MTYPQARECVPAGRHARPELRDGALGHRHDAVPAALADATRSRRRASAAGTNVQKAMALAPPTERERLYVATAQAFFVEPDDDRLLAAHPALGAGLGEAPSRAPGRRRGGRLLRARALATAPANVDLAHERATNPRRSCSACTQRNPDHPGAMHYLVHANDVPGREQELLEITRKYETVAPRQSARVAHADAHLYASRRLGRRHPRQPAARRMPRWSTRQASTASSCGTSFRTRSNISSTRTFNRATRTRRAPRLERLAATERLEPSFKTAFHIASTRARYALERQDWDDGRARRRHAARQPRLGPVPLARSDRRSTRAASARPASAGRRMRAPPASGLRALEAKRRTRGRRALCAQHPRAAPRGRCVVGAARGRGRMRPSSACRRRRYSRRPRLSTPSRRALRFPPTNCSVTCG